jgi:ABC-type nitrate/sulfonate/bicarbonate transport system substrate-binding protein
VQNIFRAQTKTMGRSKGSKNNGKHHEAGGKRKGAGRPMTKKDAPAQQRLQQSTLRNAFRVPTTEEDELLARAAIAEHQPKETEAEQAAAAKQQEEAVAHRREEQRQRMLKKLQEATADGLLDSVLECFPGDGDDDNGDDSDDDECYSWQRE